MSARRATWLRWAGRLAGLALLAYVLATQVRWSDEIVLADGRVLSGTATAESGGWRFEGGRDEPGVARFVAADEVRVRRYGSRDVPEVAYGFPTLFGRLRGSPWTVGLVLATLFALVLLTAWRWRWLVHALGLPLTPSDAVRYTLYGVFFNLVVPGATGGDVVKAYYAAKRTGAATKSVVSVLVDRLVGLFALVLFAACVLFLSPSREGYGPAKALVGAVLAAALVVGPLVLSRRVRAALGIASLLKRLPFQGVLYEVDAAIRLYRRRPGPLALGLVVSFANHAGTVACAYGLSQALGLKEIRLGDTMALVPVVALLTAIPLLPGGWGVGELAFAFFFGQVGVAPSEAVGLSVVYRLATLVSGLPGGVLWMVSRDHVRRAQMADEVTRAEQAVEAEERRASGAAPGRQGDPAASAGPTEGTG